MPTLETKNRSEGKVLMPNLGSVSMGKQCGIFIQDWILDSRILRGPI